MGDTIDCHPSGSVIDERPVGCAEGNVMGLDDKIDNKAEETGGKLKEGVGKATDDKDLEAEGHTDQKAANVKQAGEKIKDIFKS